MLRSIGRSRIAPLLFLAVVAPSSTAGYELQSHADISLQAVNSSELDSYLETQLRFDADARFDSRAILHPDVNPNGTAENWIREGSVREDDNPRSGTGVYPRPLNHFYNPLTGFGLGSAAGVLTGVGAPSPDWGLEDVSTFAAQEFSYPWARAYFYNALKGRTPTEREHQFALAFRSLGQVIHLIQDLAQPQHTRIDPHLLYAAYETYTEDDRVRSSLPFTGYPIVYGSQDRTTFNVPRNFWHTTEETVAERKGLANYSNRGFVSEGTNFVTNPFVTIDLLLPHADLPKPDGTDAVLWQPAIDALPSCKWRDPAYQPHGLLAFVQTPVHDAYTNVDDWNTMTSTESLFDPDLDASLQPKTFTLNCYNFEAAHRLLIPRAVGYSVGLINYFFRGKIDFTADFSAPNAYTIQNLGPEPLNGTFELYYDDTNGNRHLGAQWTRALDANGHGQDHVQVTASLPSAGSAGKYTLVFHGDMGEEKESNGSLGAVLGKAVRTSSFLLVDTSKFSDGYYSYNGWVTNYWGSAWSAYRSDFVDRGWKRLGGDRTYNQPPILSWNRPSCALDDRAAFVWSTGNSLALADGGASVIPTPPGFSSLAQTLDSPLSIACLGGSEVLFTFATPETAGVAYSPDLGATAQPRQGYAGGVITYVGNGSVLLQAGNAGSSIIFRSTDKGLTWSALDPTFDGETLSASDPTDPISDRLAFNVMAWNHVEGDGSVVLANGFLRHDGLARYDSFWRSTDGGDSWRFLPTTFTDGYALLSTHEVDSLAMSPQGEVLVSFVANEGTQGSPTYHTRVARSLDAGETWQLADLPEPIDNVLAYTTMGANVGFPYYSVVHAPPVVLYWPQ